MFVWKNAPPKNCKFANGSSGEGALCKTLRIKIRFADCFIIPKRMRSFIENGEKIFRIAQIVYTLLIILFLKIFDIEI